MNAIINMANRCIGTLSIKRDINDVIIKETIKHLLQVTILLVYVFKYSIFRKIVSNVSLALYLPLEKYFEFPSKQSCLLKEGHPALHMVSIVSFLRIHHKNTTINMIIGISLSSIDLNKLKFI